MLEPEERAAWIGLLERLAPGADAAPALAFVNAHREACEAELAAVPGHDQVRAGLVRVWPAVDPEGAGAALAGVGLALAAFAEDPLVGPAALRRHPAWAALVRVELAGSLGEVVDDAVLREAAAIAASGFARLSADDARAEGEVLWAIAEVAADVGWTDRSDALLAAAARAPFEDAENLARVRLLQVLRLLATEASLAPAAVDGLLALPAADARTRAHALWIGAHLDRESGRMARAVERLGEALELVEDDEEAPEVAARVRGALRAWGGHADCPAEA